MFMAMFSTAVHAYRTDDTVCARTKTYQARMHNTNHATAKVNSNVSGTYSLPPLPTPPLKPFTRTDYSPQHSEHEERAGFYELLSHGLPSIGQSQCTM